MGSPIPNLCFTFTLLLVKGSNGGGGGNAGFIGVLSKVVYTCFSLGSKFVCLFFNWLVRSCCFGLCFFKRVFWWFILGGIPTPILLM